MKKFQSSDLTHKRSDVMRAAEEHGAVIQLKRTNGEVSKEFVLMTKEEFIKFDLGSDDNCEPRVYKDDF